MLYVNPITAAPLSPGMKTTGGPEREKEQRALTELEHLFLFEMLRAMRRTLPGDAIFGKSSQKQFFEEMLDDALCGTWAASGVTGIARAMERTLHTEQSTRPLNLPRERVDKEYGISDPARTGVYAWTS